MQSSTPIQSTGKLVMTEENLESEKFTKENDFERHHKQCGFYDALECPISKMVFMYLKNKMNYSVHNILRNLGVWYKIAMMGSIFCLYCI